jgi:hypothetical protein
VEYKSDIRRDTSDYLSKNAEQEVIVKLELDYQKDNTSASVSYVRIQLSLAMRLSIPILRDLRLNLVLSAPVPLLLPITTLALVQVKVITLTASQRGVNFSITGGRNQAKFSLSGNTLTFEATSFKNPGDNTQSYGWRWG